MIIVKIMMMRKEKVVQIPSLLSTAIYTYPGRENVAGIK
jgi:hypothetical protein